MTATALLKVVAIWYPFIAFMNYLMYRQYRALGDPDARRLARIVWLAGMALELMYPLLAGGAL